MTTYCAVCCFEKCMCATHIGNPYIYVLQTTLAFESFLLVVYMLPPHSLPNNKPRLMLAIRGLSAAVRMGEQSAFVAKAPKFRRLSLTRMPIARIPGFLVVKTVEKHLLSTRARREAPVDKCARRHGGQTQEFPLILFGAHAHVSFSCIF